MCLGSVKLGLNARYELPPVPNYFTGRNKELHQLVEALLPDRNRSEEVVLRAVIEGAGGVGKTALAIKIA